MDLKCRWDSYVGLKCMDDQVWFMQAGAGINAHDILERMMREHSASTATRLNNCVHVNTQDVTHTLAAVSIPLAQCFQIL